MDTIKAQYYLNMIDVLLESYNPPMIQEELLKKRQEYREVLEKALNE